MLGRVEFLDKEGDEGSAVEQIGGVDCLCVRLKMVDGVLRGKRLRRVRKLFLTCGVSHILLPDDGVLPLGLECWSRADIRPFYRGIADVLAIGVLEGEGVKPAGAAVSLASSHLSYELCRAANLLCPKVRGICIDVPGEGMGFAQWLHREYGIPVCPPGCADLTLRFAPGGVAGRLQLDLFREGNGPAGVGLAAPGLCLPSGYEKQALSALWERGKLERSEIRVLWRKDGGISS